MDEIEALKLQVHELRQFCIALIMQMPSIISGANWALSNEVQNYYIVIFSSYPKVDDNGS